MGMSRVFALITGLLSASLHARQDSAPPGDQAAAPGFWTSFTEWLSWFWNLRAIRIGDAEVMVSQLVFAVFLVVGGIWLSR